MKKMSRWIRLHVDVTDNPKVQLLPAETFKFWMNCLCLVDEEDGRLPPASRIAWKLHMKENEVENLAYDLVKAGLLDQPKDSSDFYAHDWEDWQYKRETSTERVKQFRKRNETHETNGNVSSVSKTFPSVSVSDSDSETTNTEKASTRANDPPGYAFDEQYSDLRRVYVAWAPHIVEADFKGEAWREWSLLDPAQRGKAIYGISTRLGRLDDPAFAPSPKNYLRGRESEWNRPPRPKPKSPLDRRLEGI